MNGEMDVHARPWPLLTLLWLSPLLALGAQRCDAVGFRLRDLNILSDSSVEPLGGCTKTSSCTGIGVPASHLPSGFASLVFCLRRFLLGEGDPETWLARLGIRGP